MPPRKCLRNCHDNKVHHFLNLSGIFANDTSRGSSDWQYREKEPTLPCNERTPFGPRKRLSLSVYPALCRLSSVNTPPDMARI
ncbi:hypothetical protein BU23DRAFT_553152 [Bimuria novae-zelandiae CBS 107.79]|uniref:Uncharacterized protein n=1 Tax=Bimuria novae-zelandiae CBS 107.79 TaxID=1447943 RepID=A0A6A5VAJ6_9PLEO|nr:hypothetical protein BU23DRAFT_553152 [Bimuria novae-zelandiae CBS 107.79]